MRLRSGTPAAGFTDDAGGKLHRRRRQASPTTQAGFTGPEMTNKEHGDGSNCHTNNAEPKREPASTMGAIEPTVCMEAFMQMMTNMSQILNKAAHSAPEPETYAGCPGRWMDVFLRANPPRFSGTTNPLKAVNWLHKIQKIFAAMECPEERKVSLVELLLENDSESWWENHKRITLGNKAGKEITWEEFVKAFRGWYWPISARHRFINMLDRFTQNNLSVYDYEAQFASLLCPVPEIANTEKEQIHLFKKGLNPSIKVWLAAPTHTTYQGIVEAAKAVEHELQLQKCRNGEGRGNNNKRKPLCIEDRRDKSCYFCHQPGHLAAQCPRNHPDIMYAEQ